MMRFLLFSLLGAICLCCSAAAQPAPSIQNNFHSVYYYKISNEQAEQLYFHPEAELDTSIFSQFVLEQPDGAERFPLPYGNYVMVWLSLNKLDYQYMPVMPWRVYALPDKKYLTFQVTDLTTNKPVYLPSVTFGNKAARYDPETALYMVEKKADSGTIVLNDGHFTFFASFHKEKDYRYQEKRAVKLERILMRRPVYDVALGYRLLNRGPFDLANFVRGKHGYDYSTFREARREIRNLSRLFPKKREYTNNVSFYFSKPKYRERDTVKFKAYVLNREKGAWYDKPLLFFLRRDNGAKDIFIGKIAPERQAAGYSGQVVLHDSLGLHLDKNYAIKILRPDSTYEGIGRFRYEDYELKKAVFAIELPDDEKHYRGKPFHVSFTAKDENGLPMPDTRASLTVTHYRIDDPRPDRLFVPDTLWTLDTIITSGSALIRIPDSIFPDAEVGYSIEAVLRNSENERTELEKEVTYFPQPNDIRFQLRDDSIVLTSNNFNGRKIHVYSQDRFDNIVTDTTVILPVVLFLNAHASRYYAGPSANYEYDEDGDAKLDMDDEEPDVHVKRQLQGDTLSFFLLNSRSRPVVYHLYKGEKEIRRGTGSDFPVRLPGGGVDDYTLEWEYIWSGKVQKESILPSRPSPGVVNLKTDQPSVIYPGKEVTINVSATDYQDKPLADVSLLAYGYTSKFDATSVPVMPVLQYRPVKNIYRPSFDLENGNKAWEVSLDFPFWNRKMQLDTSWTYRFLYPSPDSIAVTVTTMPDGQTQVAPFIVKQGAVQPVYYVLIDRVPVYLGFTDMRMPYSFITDTNYHQITVRTPGKLITIPNFKARPGLKNIISVDEDRAPATFYATPMPDTLVYGERSTLQRYVMRIDMTAEEQQYAYLQPRFNTASIINLSRRNAGARNLSVGPVCWQYWTFGSYPEFRVPFEYEPGYTYKFSDSLIKMRYNSFLDLVPRRPRRIIPSLDERNIAIEAFSNDYESDLKDKRRTQHIETEASYRGNAALHFEWSEGLKNFSPINVILAGKDGYDAVNIYPGRTRDLTSIKDGLYRLVFIDESNTYFQSDTFSVRDNGYNFFRMGQIDTIAPGRIDNLNNRLKLLYQPVRNTGINRLTTPVNNYISGMDAQTAYESGGTVWDDDENEPVIGASIRVVGTHTRTMTDLDGHFDIPDMGGRPVNLEVSYYGLITQVVTAYPGMVVHLEKGDNMLTEVRISNAYGPPVSKEKYIGAADVVTGKRIDETYPADITRAIEGAAPGIQVTNGDGVEARPLVVVDGFIYNGSASDFDASVIASMSMLKDAVSTSMYGSRGANGVIVITTKKDAVLPEKIRQGLQSEKAISPEDLMAGGLRNRFSDDAYWQPDLVTDKNGKASFKVTFPDDITSWQTILVAADAHKNTGQALGNIKSFKPVAASLYTPRFLVAGDSTRLIGKALNYLPDTITASTSFYQNDSLRVQHEIRLGGFYNDTLLLTAGQEDSVRLKYLLTKPDGYFDGEEKKIPVKPLGTLVAEGAFYNLFPGDTSFVIYPSRRQDTLHLHAMASLSDLVLQEVDVVRDYGYLCNEQIASKVLALLAKQRIQEARHIAFETKDNDYIQSLLDKLAQRQNEQRLWAWWESGAAVPWISRHVTHAIVSAKARGYKCGVELAPVMDRFVFELEHDTSATDLYKLQMLSQYGAPVNYEKYISRMEHRKDLDFNTYLELVLLRQQEQLPYNTERLRNLMETDIYGNIYWKDTARFAYNNELLTTVNALNILQQDTLLKIDKNRVASWLLQQRSCTGWRNTYESARVIEALAGMIPLNDTAAMKPVLRLGGVLSEQVETFPYHKDIMAGSALEVRKQGKAPVYFTWYYNQWDTTNKQPADYFKIISGFKSGNTEVSYLKAGEPVKMNVSVKVIRSAEYVMIEIPIPAGCSYQSKEQAWYHSYEVHREYFEDRVCIFCEKLPKGDYTYSIDLLPRYEGAYTINPAKATLMYFPVMYGKEKIKKVNIRQ